jgi:tetratricopeptide (TPR) repeat protein
MLRTSQTSNIESLLAKAEDNALFRTHPDQYLFSATEAWRLAERVKDFHSVARSKLAIGQHALDVCDYPKAIKLCFEARRTFEATSDFERCAESFDYEARAFMLMGRYDESSQVVHSGLRFCGPDNSLRRGSFYYVLANLSLRKGDLISSLQNNFEALQVLRGHDERLLPFILQNVAHILRLHRHDTQASVFLSEAEQRVRAEIDRYSESMGLEASHFDLQLMGDVFSLSEKYAEAMKYYKRSYNSLHHFQCRVTEAECLISLGRTSLNLHEESEAGEYFNKALALVTKLQDHYLIAKAEIGHSDYLCSIGRPNDAELSLQKVLVFTRKTNNAALQLIVCDRLANLEERRNNFTSSARYYREANELLRSQVAFNYRNVANAAASGKSIPVPRDSAIDIAHENQVHALTSDLKDRNALLLVLRSKLREIVLMREEQRLFGIRALIALVAEHLKTAEQTSSLREGLKSLNEDFLERLQIKHPDLTATELHICSFLALGFSNSEIERLLFFSTRTLECHRLHIRRKMALKRNTKLEQAIQLFKDNPH